MAARKGNIPAHVERKIFVHPQINHPAIQLLEGVEDPRKPSLFFRYSLTSVLLMVIVAQICGAKDWPQVVVMCEGMRDWLATYVDMAAGVPCERTFKNIFCLIKPERMEELLRQAADYLRERIPRGIVSFDGQTERGTCNKSSNTQGLHLLNAWSSENGICLGQVKVDEKSNEMTAMPGLIESLDLKGAVITADALNTQKNIVAKAVAAGADYVLPVKGNQPNLQEEIMSGFTQLDLEQAKAREHWQRAIIKATEHRDAERLLEPTGKWTEQLRVHNLGKLTKRARPNRDEKLHNPVRSVSALPRRLGGAKDRRADIP